MTRPLRAALVLLVAVVAAVALTACGAPDDEMPRPTPTVTLPPEPPTDLVALPVGSGDVGPRSTVTAGNGTLRVDGRTVHLAPMRVDGFAVVRGGVFFLNGHELWFTDLTRARATGYEDVTSLVASPDGTRLAFLDLQHGPKDHHGTPLAISIAYDATTGKPLVASYAGMGDVTRDDLAARYRQVPPRVVGFDGDALVVHGVTGDFRVPFHGTPQRLTTSPPAG